MTAENGFVVGWVCLFVEAVSGWRPQMILKNLLPQLLHIFQTTSRHSDPCSAIIAFPKTRIDCHINHFRFQIGGEIF